MMTKLFALSAGALLLSIGAATAMPHLPKEGLPAVTANTASIYGVVVPGTALNSAVSYGNAESYDGTGYYGHGTATGGPVGGLPNRN